MKGFKDKSGKFRPTGNKSKSSLKKSDVKRSKGNMDSGSPKFDNGSRNVNDNDYHKVEQANRDTYQFFRTLKGSGQDWAYMHTENNEDTIADGTVVLYDLEDNPISEIPTVNFLAYIQQLIEDQK